MAFNNQVTCGTRREGIHPPGKSAAGFLDVEASEFGATIRDQDGLVMEFTAAERDRLVNLLMPPRSLIADALAGGGERGSE